MKKTLLLFVSLLVSQSALAIYMSDGEFLFDGKNLMISAQTFELTTKSDIKDVRRYNSFIMQDREVGFIERNVKSSRFALKAECIFGRVASISLFQSKGYDREHAIVINVGGKTYYRPVNARDEKNGDGEYSAFHIESIENYLNPLESMSSSGGGRSDNVMNFVCRKR